MRFAKSFSFAFIANHDVAIWQSLQETVREKLADEWLKSKNGEKNDGDGDGDGDGDRNGIGDGDVITAARFIMNVFCLFSLQCLATWRMDSRETVLQHWYSFNNNDGDGDGFGSGDCTGRNQQCRRIALFR